MKIPLVDSTITPQDLEKSLCEMRDSLVELSLALKDALFEAQLRERENATEPSPQCDCGNGEMGKTVDK